MSKSQIVSKIRRVLHLFFGMRNPSVAAALAPFGYTAATMQEGWALLQAANRKSKNAIPMDETEPQLLEHISEFEDRWFPVARSVLERGSPGVAITLFHNLGRESGREVSLNVATFVERLAEMPKPQGVFGTSGRAARKLLADRGLTLELEQQARAWLDALALAREPRVSSTTLEDERVALSALWLWYREWSSICRVAIKDRVLLRKLGFRKNKYLEEEETEEEPAVVPPAVGTGAVGGGPYAPATNGTGAPGAASGASSTGSSPATSATSGGSNGNGTAPAHPSAAAPSQPPASGVLPVVATPVPLALPAAASGVR